MDSTGAIDTFVSMSMLSSKLLRNVSVAISALECVKGTAIEDFGELPTVKKHSESNITLKHLYCPDL